MNADGIDHSKSTTTQYTLITNQNGARMADRSIPDVRSHTDNHMTFPQVPSKREFGIHNLYWCTTPEHSDDALVVAKSKNQAEQFLTDMLGCDLGDVTAMLVKNLKASMGIDDLEAGYVEDSILDECSAFIGKIGPARVVYLDGRCYVEGILDFVMEEARRQMGPEGLKEFLGR